MNEKVEQIIAQHKRDFLISHELYNKEYATYKVTCKGYDVDNTTENASVYFTFESKEKIELGDVVLVTLEDGKVHKMKISDYTCKEISDNIEKEYPLSEYATNYPDGCRRYKKVVIDVTNEEYELLKRELGEKPSDTAVKYNESKTVANIFYAIATLIFVVGFIVAIYIASKAYNSGFTFLITALVTFIQGMLFIGFGKIIALLVNITNK